ncbi:phage minor head protein [Streptomyces sp. AD55]|uniref:phage minor head protein n=1 Tax=Streptomyces sp. AD55 TaxID=3242895 RepID=UPI00352957AA
MAEDWEMTLTAAEETVAAEVRAILDEIAAEFAAGLDGATGLVAARFSVSGIGRMFRERVPRLLRLLFSVVGLAALDAADSIDETLPDGWDDLPARYDDGTLPAALHEYAQTAELHLNGVGDRLALVAVLALAAGIDAGEDLDELRARLLAVFDAEGAQLGQAREERIAATEPSRAWNAAVLAVAAVFALPKRPILKTWQTRRDTHVRDAHRKVDGQSKRQGEPFVVAGVPMQGPGDPSAPPELVIRCRCVLRLRRERPADVVLRAIEEGIVPVSDLALTASGLGNTASRTADAHETKTPSRPGVSESKDVRMHLDVQTPENTERAIAAALARELRYAASPPARTITAAGGSEHTGGMIALVPTEADVQRLALDNGEMADELHLTLWYLGSDVTDWTSDQRAELIDGIRARAEQLPGPVAAAAFGINHWNPHGEDPVWVWAVGDAPDQDDDAPSLNEARWLAVDALESTHQRPDTPAQHSPWVAHVTGAYTSETWPLEAMTERLGPIRFDRIRIAFAGDHTDIPLGPQEEPPMDEATAATTMPTRTWSTPKGEAALAYENQETGDGRVFAPGALYWESGPWPLQYADEMLMGHEGAELAGAILEMRRDGDSILGHGPLYLSQRAGVDAVLLLEQKAPLGVSVDLDDVDIELVDTTGTDGEDGGVILAASVPTMSALRLADGAWTFTATTTSSLSAAGTAFTRSRRTSQLITGPNGQVTAAAVRTALDGAGVEWTGQITAAAGDPDAPEDGVIVHTENSGDYLLRITRARVRGATLVSMPAYAGARIVLDPVDQEQAGETVASAAPSDDHERVISYVRSSPVPLGAQEVAAALDLSVEAVRGHLARASKAGSLVRLAPGLYVGPSSLPEGPDLAAAADPAWPLGDDLTASAWAAMRELPPMPAAWFAEPTHEELPPGSGGVHYKGGRIYGWVAQRGVPHAGYPGQNLTIEKIAKRGLDFSHFLRARFNLDDGATVAAGAFTMNVGHHRDGAECETEVCQFDDSRTVAGIVTVGMSKGGLWFSGAAAPWLSEWDRAVFQGCQPSYHLNQGPGGRWELRAVLSVPVPGHSSPLRAAAVVERTNLALAASAALAQSPPAAPAVHDPQPQAPPAGPPAADALADALAAALARPDFVEQLAAAVHQHDARQAARREEIARLTAEIGTTDAVTAAGATAKGDN